MHSFQSFLAVLLSSFFFSPPSAASPLPLLGLLPLAAQTYDYVVIGGGTAGLALASRLSENSGISVAVVEAGTTPVLSNPLLSSTPAGDVIGAGSSPSDVNPAVDWGFVTEPQEGANGRRIHYARGKALGGSSERNFMVYQRPTIESLDKWASEVGDDSYSWSNFLPFFKKSVEFTPPSSKRASNATAEFDASAFSSGAGPLQVSFANYASPFSSYVEGGMNAIGIRTTNSFNDGSLFGAQYCTSTINPDNQKRSSSRTSFLGQAQGRSNLHVKSPTLAQEILFDSNKRATGVRVKDLLFSYTINARKEIILSAGAFQSPQILMLSGIGPEAELSKFNIPAVKILEGVGQNMQDHVFAGPSYPVSVDTLTLLANNPIQVVPKFLSYILSQTGPLTNPVCDFIGWEKLPDRTAFSTEAQSELAAFPNDWPEVEYISGAGYVGDFSNLLLNQPRDGRQYATILAALIAPLSRGTVTLASNSANDKPLIDPRWLTSDTDKQVMVAAYKRARAAFASDAMQKGVIGEEKFPGPDVQTDEQILETIRDSVHTVWHASCTCKMGKPDDDQAVVDSKARVFGVTGLRVVDASSFPFLVPGHPQSTIYALAEKIADDILSNL